MITGLKALALMAPDAHFTGTAAAVIFGLTYNFIPFMTLPLYSTLERLDTRYSRRAATCTRDPSMTFFKVTIPLSMPGIVSGVLLTFIPAAGDYINASSDFLGGTGTAMIGNVIESNFLVTAQLSGGGVAVDHPDGGDPGDGHRLRQAQRNGGPAVTVQEGLVLGEAVTAPKPPPGGRRDSVSDPGCCRRTRDRAGVPAHPDRLHLRVLVQRLDQVEHRLARFHARQVAQRLRQAGGVRGVRQQPHHRRRRDGLRDDSRHHDRDRARALPLPVPLGDQPAAVPADGDPGGRARCRACRGVPHARASRRGS